ncbi:MAG: DUF58 domain-containing protein [Anaerolinea sp.]|nr:DUF58 domain-containing protein [Anaerolinea sp.]
MLTPELIRKIRQIEIHTRHLVNDSFAGEYHAVFKGRGMEFDEVRPYTPGDDVRAIDWNVTARSGEPYVKRYVEERELTVMLLVDASASGDFGSVNWFKREMAAELTAVLAFAATTNNDKVGLLIFTDQIELYIPPRKGRKHVLRLIRDLLTFQPQGRGTDIRLALEMVNHALKRRSILFLVSDFLADVEDYGRLLGVTNRRHDLVAVDLNDPLEQEFAGVGLVALEDAETGALTWIDTRSHAWQTAFRQRSEQMRQAKRDAFNRARVDRISVTTATDYVTALTQFFQKRARRR